ncbi:conserved hypothetical protein [Vibrio crassostreae]|uniref:Uncharacterized protein n=1 Tax=Vibrio crassostreae TaxID=246167 RepID=A0A822MW13_9VIBR|nr:MULTISPECIES: hypothetical protein [Vibrio]MDH5939394.1 hypothetical protein [Vibrio splendidus]MDH5953090.1 hypothetical protein [Vibrio crassostreae]TCL15395.1 hypothetical protein EDB52_1373 [Vibrio crassostreae]TCN00550.1 hypothetical protein EDB35_14124 [Vibrio crassostreae]TCT41202.1 hypothetical protein EDB39_14211 [Vibrio crassostreae]
MAQRNSTPTLSKLNPATNVSPLARESSPKNDISLCEGQIGFIQLIDCNSKQVLAQREGLNDEASFEYLKTNVWNMSKDVVMQFVVQTDHVHPTKFFNALSKNSKVKVYHSQLTHDEPVDVKPCWEGTAEQVEESNAVIERQQWDAFDAQGNWIGTSEY